MKRLVKFLIPLLVMLSAAVSAQAYNVTNLPEKMNMQEALGIFDVSDITRATVSAAGDDGYIELTKDEIKEFFDKASAMTLTRTINATPFRGTAINLYTASGVQSYNLTSGVQIGMYGTLTYICYQADDSDAQELLYLDDKFKDSAEIKRGETIHVNTANDFLKMPTDDWAKVTIEDAASRCLVPYKFTSKYPNSITREEFCELIDNMICVAGNYANLDRYMNERGESYSKNYFSDCSNKSINILHALGVVNGKSDDLFDPDGIITREEAAAFVCRTAELFTYTDDSEELGYDDLSEISVWARRFVAWVSDNFIMNGTDGSFLPKNTYTVQEAITTVNRLYKVIAR